MAGAKNRIVTYERRHRSLGSSRNVPKEFFCPISKEFMTDPVIIPNSDLPHDRDSVTHLFPVRPDLKMRKRMNVWFSHYTNDPPFESISTRGFLVGSAISVAKKRDLSLLRKFASVIAGKQWLLKNGGGMWCVATLLSCENPSVKWVATVLYIVADVDNDEKLLVPEGIHIGIHPDYSILDPIKKALKYYAERYDGDEGEGDEDFQKGFGNLMHGLVMSSPDLSSMEVKMEGIVEALVNQMWPLTPDFEFDDDLLLIKRLATFERLSHNHKFSERMIDSEIISMLLYVMNSRVESIEKSDGRPPSSVDSLAIGTCMRTLERLCHHCLRAHKIFDEVLKTKEALIPHLKLVGHYFEGSDFLNQFLGEPRAQFRIDICDPSLMRIT